jgi:hypothetical protein
MVVIYAMLGLLAGVASGFLGIGGGTILIPIMVYMFGLTQHEAQGTTLAIMIPPIGLLAAIKYYLEGNVKLNMAIFICLGFFIGGLIGAQFAHKIPDPLLKKLFGVFLLGVSLKMILGR